MGYILVDYRLTRREYKFICDAVKKNDPAVRKYQSKYHRLFAHLVASTLIRIGSGETDLAIPVKGQLIQRRIGHEVTLPKLAKVAPITHSGYDKAAGLSMEATVDSEFMDAFLIEMSSVSPEEYLAERHVNLKGEPYPRRRKPERTRLSFEETGRGPMPEDHLAEIKALRKAERLFNMRECHRVLKEECGEMMALKAVSDQYEAEHGRSSPLYKEAYDNYQTAKRRYRHDYSRFRAVLNRRPQRTKVQYIWKYNPYYKLSETYGRFYETGFQGASKRLKKASLIGIDNVHDQQIYECDVVACHPNALRLLCKRHNIDKTWLDEKLKDELFREKIAERTGVPVKVVKEAMNAILNGAEMPTALKIPRVYANGRTSFPENSIQKMLREELGDDKKTVEEAMQKLGAELRPLIEIVEEFHRWALWYESKNATGRNCKNGKGKYIVNEAGLKFYTKDMPKDEKERKKKLGAFFYQGIETRFIAIVISLGKYHGYTTMANDHDGLITIGKIPRAAIDEAIRLTGFEYAELKQELCCVKLAA